MPYRTLNSYSEETHRWEPYIPERATKLILGTFPTAERNQGTYEFFYPNPNNDFWNIIFRVDGKNLNDFVDEEPVALRKRILENLNLGIADIGKKILRQKGSSKDENLFPLEFEDILSVLENHRDIKTIIVTSSSGENSVLSWFHQYCALNDLNFSLPHKKENLPKKTFMLFKDERIDIIIISSPSRQSRIKGEKLFDMYEEAILG